MKKIFTVFIAVLTIGTVSAQWSSDFNENLQVSSLKSSVNYTAKTSDGKTYVFFLEENSTDHYVPRLQLLDSDGTKLFGEDGMVVNSTAEFSTYVQVSDIAVDTEDNAIVSFYGTGDGNLYANKISPEGVNIWGDSGIVVGSGSLPKIVGLDDGVIIGYTQSGKGYLTKLSNADGTALWDSPLIFNSPVSGSSYTTITELTRLSDDSFVAINIAKGTSWGIYGSLVAQRYDSDGNALWASPAILTTSSGVQYNIRYNHLVDEEDSVYISYFTSGINGSKFDAYVQKVASDGTLPWGDHGKELSSGSYNEMKTDIGISGNDLWAISTFKNSTQGQSGEYVQKYDKSTGEAAFTSEVELYPLSTSGGKQHITSIQFLGGKPVVGIINNGDTSVTATIISLLSLNSDGSIYKTLDFSPSSVKDDITLLQSDADQVVAVWIDSRDSETPRIYAQNFKDTEVLETTDNQKLQYSVYPNPFTSEINIISSDKIIMNTIFDRSGKLVYTGKGDKIKLNQLPSGLYIIRTTFRNGNEKSMKIIKK